MSENGLAHGTIRDYFLGTLKDKAAWRQIERKLLLDDTFAEELLIAENKLIEDYLDDVLDDTERKCFKEFYLSSPYRKRQVKITRHLRKHAMKAEPQMTGQTSKAPPGFFDWRQLFSSPAFRFAALFLIVAGLGFGIWQLGFSQSVLDKGLAQLHLAHSAQRPFESRIADFDYASLAAQRGARQPEETILTARDRARALLMYAATEHTTPGSLHALGQFYLAEKDFDRAIEYFGKALELLPADAKLQSDLGTALLEAAKKAASEKDHAKSMELYDKSLDHIKKAIELNPKLLEPRFNKALNLQAVFLQKEAMQAWLEYLELDPNSDWAKEARSHLQKLELKKTQNLSSDEIEKTFLTTFREKNDAQSEQLISRNRELIKKKYLPQRLAMSFVSSPLSERSEYLRALIYAGELEKKSIGDPFASEIAGFYKTASEPTLSLLKSAQASMQKGYDLCLHTHFSAALKEFESARTLFLQVGDHWEAKLSELFIVYCLTNTDRIKDSLPIAEEVAEFCQKNNYKWLHSTIRFWLAAAQRAVRLQSKAKANFQISLDIAEEIGDSSLIQLILMALARQSSFVGQNKEALGYLQKAFENGDAPESSLRQKWRNYSDGIELLANAKLFSLAKAVSLENIQIVADYGEADCIIYSEIDAGIVLSRTGELDEARQWFHRAKQNTASVTDIPERKMLLTKTLLELGHLERKQGNNLQAEQLYDEAYGYIENTEDPNIRDLYEIQRSRLFVYSALGDDTKIEKQVRITLALAERYRNEMPELKEFPDESERVSFFDSQQPTYDIAVSNSFTHQRYEQAYNYLENSNARSLLNWLQKGASARSDYREIDANFGSNTEPLRLDGIRRQMPENVQIVQYAVLEDKVLIWLVTKDNFTVVSSQIGYDELNKKVQAYLQLVTANDGAKQTEADLLAAQLYTSLITPIVGQLDPHKTICLIPQKILVDLSFAALIGKNGKPFLSEFELFYAPSANIFLLCTSNAKNKTENKDETLLSVGNPDFDRKEFSDLDELSEAENEAVEIAKLYPNAQKLLGPEATKSAFLQYLPNAEIVQFAGHYIVKRGESLNSSLILAQDKNDPAGGTLTNAELGRLNLSHTKLVVLSACQTGVERYYNGEGLVGLSRTFLAAGVPLVVASNWKVDSGATAELMKRFHSYRQQEKLSTATALRRAQLEMIDSTDSRFSRPYYWAAFAAFGGYAEF